MHVTDDSIMNADLVRQDFPMLSQTNREKPLIYLDSAASAQKPKAVVQAITDFYYKHYANIHRGIYELSEQASELYEYGRVKVKEFIHAAHADEIIFVRGATEGINLIAQCLGKKKDGKNTWCAQDEIIISAMEHHSNIVPWYLLQQQYGIRIKIVPVNEIGELDIEAYQQLFSPHTKLVSVCHVSNAIGTINPIKHMTEIAHAHGVPILIDGAQAAPHMQLNMQELDCDFYVFSAHKLYGPTGIGVLYGKKQLLDALPPYQGGGGMIEHVTFDHISFAQVPERFEAGTPDIAGVIGLTAAIDYVQKIGMHSIFSHEQTLLHHAETALKNISGLRIIGEAKQKIGVISIVMDDIHAHDLGTVLDHEGIAVRAGHHCAMPLMQHFNVPATLRISFGLYNCEHDIVALIDAITLAKRLFS